MELQKSTPTILAHAPTALEDTILRVEKKKVGYFLIRGGLKFILQPSIHYGPPWPGSAQDCLLLAGAEAACKILNCFPGTPILEKEEWDHGRGFYYFRYRVDLIDCTTRQIVASAIASCNSHEDAFRYRNANRKCPECGKESIFKSKFPDKATGDIGFYCNRKSGGCGANFDSNDEAITGQEIGKVENQNPAQNIANIEARAIKRATVKAVRTYGCLSATFSQDAEDFHGQGVIVEARARDIETPQIGAAQTLTKAELDFVKTKIHKCLVDLATVDRDGNALFAEAIGNPKARVSHIDQIQHTQPEKVEKLLAALAYLEKQTPGIDNATGEIQDDMPY